MGATVGAVGLALCTAAPAVAGDGAVVDRRTDCGFGPEAPGDESIPGTGVTEFIPATACQVVVTPAGRLNFVLRAELPEGVSLDRALTLDGTVVTPSGRIIGHGSFG